MSFKQKEVKLVVGQVGREKLPLIQGAMPEGSMIPNEVIRYEVLVGGETYKVNSINQRFMVNGYATLMMSDGKPSLMYHKLGIESQPFVLNNPDLAEFFGGTPPNELYTTYYTKKFKLFGGGTKKMEKAMKAGQSGTRSEALIMKFETGMETHTPNKTTITGIMTLLVKEQGGFFITQGKGKIRGTRREGFLPSPILGLAVNVTYDPDNKSCIVIDGE